MGNKLTLYAIVIILLTVTVSLPVLSCAPVMQDKAEVIIPDDIDSMYWSRLSRNLDEDALALANGNNDFCCDLYHEFINDREGNFVYSPYSIYLAFAMAYAGARGNTATEIADTLHFNLPADAIPAAFQKLNEIISQPDTSTCFDVPSDGNLDFENTVEKENYTLNIANALWGQEGYPFLSPYINTVDKYYGGGLESLDFTGNPEKVAEIINEWIGEQTEDRINDIISPSSIGPLTKLIITNAIYFFAYWENQFDENDTEDKPFHLINEEVIDVPTMHQKLLMDYTEGYGYQAVILQYKSSELDMIIVLPDIDTFEAFDRSLDSLKLKAIVNKMESREVDLALPKFEYTSKYEDMRDTFQKLGIVDAFKDGVANFSGITEIENLYIENVIHQTFILVNEEGTEAAAATVIPMAGSPPPPPPATFTADHPFIYFIQHQKTGAILFMGRVLNPAE
jgi:serpin B